MLNTPEQHDMFDPIMHHSAGKNCQFAFLIFLLVPCAHNGSCTLRSVDFPVASAAVHFKGDDTFIADALLYFGMIKFLYIHLSTNQM